MRNNGVLDLMEMFKLAKGLEEKVFLLISYRPHIARVHRFSSMMKMAIRSGTRFATKCPMVAIRV